MVRKHLQVDNKISVICPTYNSERFIQRSIDSIKNQIDVPNEIVFSDDGSTDETINIINNNKDSLNKKKIKVTLLTNKHEGPGSARNKGIENSSFNWIAFLDSDDIWMPEKIQLVRSYIEKKDDILITHWEDYIKLNGEKVVLKHGIHIKSEIPLPTQLYKKNFLSTSAIVLNKKLIQKVGGFNAYLPNGQDYDLWLRLSSFVEIIVIEKSLGVYIQEINSITSRPYFYRIKSNIIIAWNHRDKSSMMFFILKLLRIIFSKEWLKVFSK